MNYSSVVSAIEKPTYNEKVVKVYQDTDDIIKDLVYCFKKFNYQAQPVAKKYSTGNIKVDGQEIYNFIRKNIAYEAEPEKDQTTRSFSRIIHDKWGDCKHTALIVGSIGWNSGYTVIFRVVRYVMYNPKKEYLYHVYTILENKSGQRVIVDPLQHFNYEKPFDKKIGDFKALNNMTLTRLTGVPGQIMQNDRSLHGDETYALDSIGGREIMMTSLGLSDEAIGQLEDIQGIGRKTKAQRQEKKAERKEKRVEKKDTRQQKRADKKQVRQEKKAVRQDKRQDKKAARQDKKADKKEKRGGSIVKKIALAPVRGAYSALILLNFRNHATRFQKAIDGGKEAQVMAFAKKFGYNYGIFKNQIKKGSTKKAMLGHISATEVHQVEGMGVIVTAAGVTAAAVAIAAATALFKQLGLGEGEDAQTLKDAADNLSKGETNVNIDAGGGSGESGDGGSGGGSGGGEGGATTDGAGPAPAPGTTPTPRDGFLKDIPTPVIVVGAIGLAYIGGKVFKIW